MNVRWRLIVLIIQASLVAGATYIVTGRPYAVETWYAAGILAVAINPQLLEPYYTRPGDVIGNSVFSLLLYAAAQKSVAQPGWTALAYVLVALILLGLVAMAFGAGRTRGPLITTARAANIVVREATSIRIYSVIFWLSLFEAFPSFGAQFWTLAFTWAIVVGLDMVDWQHVWAAFSGALPSCRVEGMIGPSSLLVSAPDLPVLGSWVSLESGKSSAVGVITSRVTRANDTWAEIHVEREKDCEVFAKASTIGVTFERQPDQRFLGSVDVGSDDSSLMFSPIRDLEVGKVVSVAGEIGDIIYQISSAKVREQSVKGGSRLHVEARATQLGTFDQESLRLLRHRWVPGPGVAVQLDPLALAVDDADVPGSWMLLGHVIGTQIPVFIDLELAQEGHLAILGMTKMGKTCLAFRIASQLAGDRFVAVMDQTGEYRSKRQVVQFQQGQDMSRAGLSVVEPLPNQVPAAVALQFLDGMVRTAKDEYERGAPVQRAILIDEAHQFVPEPAVLGFGAPGRDASLKFGVLTMQVRKYGITIILVSQRTAVVAKSALSQCENLIAFKSVDRTGLDYLEAVAGGDVREILPRLRQGEALVFGPAISSDSPVAVRVLLEQAPSANAG